MKRGHRPHRLLSRLCGVGMTAAELADRTHDPALGEVQQQLFYLTRRGFARRSGIGGPGDQYRYSITVAGEAKLDEMHVGGSVKEPRLLLTMRLIGYLDGADSRQLGESLGISTNAARMRLLILQGQRLVGRTGHGLACHPYRYRLNQAGRAAIGGSR